MLTAGKALALTITEWRGKMPYGLAVLIWTVSICVAVFYLMPVAPLHGQGLLSSRSSGDDQHKTNGAASSQSGNDFVSIPWDSLDIHATKRIRDVMDGKTFFRQMPRQLGYCDAEMYDFMISHPDVVVELWELLGVAHISLKETGPNKYLLKEGAATTSQVEVLYKSKNLCVVYASGEYDAPVLRRKIKGDVVLLLKSRYGHDKENRPVVQCDLDAYVRIHNPGAEMLAKILIPVVGKIADSNFEQAVGFVMNVSEAAQDDFEPLVSLAQRMKNVRPEVAEEFAFVSEAVFDREVDRYVALASAAQQSVAELAHPTTHSPTESPVVPKYTRHPDQNIVPQKDTLAVNEPRLAAPAAPLNDLGGRLIPMTTSDMRQEVPKNQQNLTTGRAVGASESSEAAATDILSLPPRRLTITNDDRSIIRGTTNTSEQSKSNRQPNPNIPIMAPVPAFGQTIGQATRSERAQEIAPSVGDITARNAVTTNDMTTNLSTTTNTDRVMINSISPSSSMLVARSVSPYPHPAPTPGNIGQMPSAQFGTTSPVGRLQSGTQTPPYPDRLPMPVFLPSK